MKIVLFLFLSFVFCLKILYVYAVFKEIVVNDFRGFDFFIFFSLLCFETTSIVGFLFFYFKLNNKSILAALFLNLCSMGAMFLLIISYGKPFYAFLHIVFLFYLIFLLKRAKNKEAPNINCSYD